MTKPISPATVMNPYNHLFGFMTVAGVIGINSTWIKGVNWESKDADSINISGYYLNLNTMKNVPSQYGTLISYVYSAGHFVQYYSVASDVQALYYRTKTSNIWSPWQRIDNFGYNSLAELAAALKPLL